MYNLRHLAVSAQMKTICHIYQAIFVCNYILIRRFLAQCNLFLTFIVDITLHLWND